MSYSIEHTPTNPDATPLYNTSIFAFWNWFNEVWSCSDWIIWHKAMVKKYGLTLANENFKTHWDNLALGSSVIDCRSFNNDFINYTKSVGLYDFTHGGLLGTITSPLGAGTAVVSNVSSGAISTSKILKTVVPLLLIVAIVYLSIKYTKKIK